MTRISRALVLSAVFGISSACSDLDFGSDGGPVHLTERVALSAGPTATIRESWGAAACARESNSEFHWIRCRTEGKGAPGFLESGPPIEPALDLQGRSVWIRVRVSPAERLQGLELRVASHSFDPKLPGGGFAAWTVPLFADARFNVIQSGVWTPLSFSLGTARVEGSVDFHQIRHVGLYFADNGSGPLDLAWSGLSTVELASQGYLSLTFDDGSKGHASIAAPAMQRHGFRGTAYIMPDQVGEDRFVDEADLAMLAQDYGWDVAAHHGIAFTGFPRRELEVTILGVQDYLRNRGYQKGLGHLAYPLGRQDPRIVRPLVRKHFETARLAGAGPETIPPADPHLLRAVNVLDRTTPEELGAIARRAADHREWAILMFHVLTDEPQLEIEYSVRDFGRALQAIAESGVEVLPVSEVWERIGRIRTVRERPAAAPAPAAPAS